jgi:hypothetical protein
VSKAPLYALVIYGIGCVIPTPLDQAQAQPNLPPVIITNSTDYPPTSPKFGLLARLSTDQVTIHVVAEDPNQTDQLTARLFVQRGDKLDWFGPETKLTQLDTDHPLVRIGDFTLKLCDIYQGTTTYLFLVVADRPFDPTGSDTAPGGLVDENHWELQCM